MRLAIIEWLDSTVMEGWRSKDDMNETPVKCVTCGVFKETKHSFSFAQSLGDNRGVGSIMIIPKCSVKRVRYLTIKPEKKRSEPCLNSMT